MRPWLIVSAAALLLLAVVAAVPYMTVFTDTSAYASASSYFRGSSWYTFDGIHVLEPFYRIPAGYYLNSALASGSDFSVAYNFVWVTATFMVFGWAMAYFFRFRLSAWTERARLVVLTLACFVYALVSVAAPYSLASGNLETQVVFVSVALVFAADRNFAAVALAPMAALLFSPTALLAFPAILVAMAAHSLLRGSRRELGLLVTAGAGVAVLAFLVYWRGSAGPSALDALAAVACVFGLAVPALWLASPKWRWANAPAAKWPNAVFAWFRGRGLRGRPAAYASASVFLVLWLAAAAVSFWVVVAGRAESYVVIATLVSCGILTAVFFVRAVKAGTPDPLAGMLSGCSLAYLVLCACLVPTGIFSNAAGSAWRFAFSSGTFGYFSLNTVLLTFSVAS